MGAFFIPMKKTTNTESNNRQKKEKLVAEIAEKMSRSKALVFSNYEGLTHQQLEELKRGLKKADAELLVAKNTLLKLALKQNNLPVDETTVEQLQKPTATLFAYSDVVLPLKELSKMIKALKMPVVKYGILEGKNISADQVQKLATLPSREVLLGQVVGMLNSPIQGLHSALNGTIVKFVMTLNAIQKTKTS